MNAGGCLTLKLNPLKFNQLRNKRKKCLESRNGVNYICGVNKTNEQPTKTMKKLESKFGKYAPSIHTMVNANGHGLMPWIAQLPQHKDRLFAVARAIAE